MIKIKDGTALGAFSGILATIPQLLFDYLSVTLGYSNYYAFQLSGSIYLLKELTYMPAGLILGGLVWESQAILLGVITVYYLRATSTDFWWLKGLLVSNALMYTIIYGFLFTLGGAKIVPFNIPTNFTVLIGNTIFGLSIAYFIIRFGDDKLLKKRHT